MSSLRSPRLDLEIVGHSHSPAWLGAPAAPSRTPQQVLDGPAEDAPRLDRVAFGLRDVHTLSVARRLERSLERMPGVTEARVDDALETLTVALLGGTTTAEQLVAWLASHGVTAWVREDRKTRRAQPKERRDHVLLRTLLLAVPGMIIGGVHDLAEGLNPQVLDILLNIQALLATATITVGAGPVVQRALRSLRDAEPTGDSLPILAGLGVYVASGVAFVTGQEPQFGAAIAAVAGAVVLDRLWGWLIRRTRNQLGRLEALQRTDTQVLQHGQVFTMGPEDAAVGDVVVLRRGSVVPADGVVVAGTGSARDAVGVDVGEGYRAGMRMWAGQTVEAGALAVRIVREQSKSSLRHIIRLLTPRDASDPWLVTRRSRAVLVASGVSLLAAAAVYVGLTVSGAEAGGIGGGPVRAALAALLATTPLAASFLSTLPLLTAVARGVQHGVLFREPESVAEMARLREVYFDKTGTLTVGQPKLEGWIRAEGVERDHVLGLIMSLEGHGEEHPVARELLRLARAELVDANRAPDLAQLEVLPGRGVVGQDRDGVELRLGNRELMLEGLIRLEEGLCQVTESADVGAVAIDSLGCRQTVVYLAEDRKVVARFHLYDPVRDGARRHTLALAEVGLTVGIVSGDSLPATKACAEVAGIGVFRGGMSGPQQEAFLAERQMAVGPRVGVVVDGWQDEATRRAADLSVLFGVGAAVDELRDDVVVMRPSLASLVRAFELASGTWRRSVQGAAAFAAYAILAWWAAWTVGASVDLAWFVGAGVLMTAGLGVWLLGTGGRQLGSAASATE